MKTDSNPNHELVSRSYLKLSEKLVNFVNARITDRATAEDLAQDVWMRLLSTTCLLEEQTIESYIFTVARNIIHDHLRHIYVVNNAQESMLAEATDCDEVSPEQILCASDIARHEETRVKAMPQQRRIVYMMSRYEDRNVQDIAMQLNLSQRTVENHLRIGRHDVRSFIAAIA